MTLHYGLVSQTEDRVEQSAEVTLNNMRAPVERLTDDSPIYALYPGVKPRLLRLSGRMVGGTGADPTIEVRIAVCGMNLVGTKVAFYQAKLGTFGSGALSVTVNMDQWLYNFPVGFAEKRFVSAIGTNDYGPTVPSGDVMLAGVAFYDGDNDLNMSIAQSTDSEAAFRTFDSTQQSPTASNGGFFRDHASAFRYYPPFGELDVDRIRHAGG
jgi:hypothetical protein